MKKHIHIQYHQTKYASFVLGSFKENLCLLDFTYRTMRQTIDKRIQKGFEAVFVQEDNEILKETRAQIDAYFDGKRTQFDIPFVMVGTEFQRRVWNALMHVSYGTTSTYLQLAKDIGCEKAVRAVANANGANALGLVIPCHRIIGSNGHLTGYAGGLKLKKRLLTLEGTVQQSVSAPIFS
jgi:methylated-DNA-[protein]-cysteine S-methyltransferase